MTVFETTRKLIQGTSFHSSCVCHDTLFASYDRSYLAYSVDLPSAMRTSRHELLTLRPEGASESAC